MSIVQVLVFRGTPILYSYTNPFDDDLVGRTVEISLGRGLAKGLVVAQTEDASDKLKPILSIVDKNPCVPKDVIALMLWFADYYQCTPYKAFQTIVGTKSIREVTPPTTQEAKDAPYSLSDDQQTVISTITQAPKHFDIFYIHGVTGCGKTEIYMQLAAALLKEGKTSLILVPEIALTPQYTRLFEERFGDVISVIHSGLTPKGRDVEWNRILNGHARVVIGPRSAIFAPMKDLGLIIMDEEHEPSYKQDSHPRYDTHAVAEYRAQVSNAWLVYGSATPRVETYARCQEENRKIFTLRSRVSGNPLPSVQVVNMVEAYQASEGGLISKVLEQAVADRLTKKEKSIILINRRGFSTYVVCQKCNAVHDCPQCGLSYTYHHDKSFRCHRCGIITGITHTCRKCHSPRLAFAGTGIQKVELELQRLFPDAAILRLDKDTAKNTKDMEAILSEFREHGDILIGTQLIAKGHHIDTVTLVGVIGIDTTLNMPDFRSPERTFQLLTQVAGRAGRGKVPGHVIIQTLQPHHPSIIHAQTHDFDTFYKDEMSYRDMLSYPPFSELIHIIISSIYDTTLKKFCRVFETQLFECITRINPDIPMVGPKPAPFEKVRNHHRWDVIIKCSKDELPQLKEALRPLMKPPKDIRLMCDYDPYSLL